MEQGFRQPKQIPGKGVVGKLLFSDLQRGGHLFPVSCSLNMAGRDCVKEGYRRIKTGSFIRIQIMRKFKVIGKLGSRRDQIAFKRR